MEINRKCIVFLEGGYNLNNLESGAEAVVRVLMG